MTSSTAETTEDTTAYRPVVAVLGTGIMGSGMARSLLRAGLDVRAWNRTQSRAAPLAADGAVVTGTAEEAVRGADVVVTMLSDGPSVAAALAAASGECTPVRSCSRARRSGSTPPPISPSAPRTLAWSISTHRSPAPNSLRNKGR